MEHHININLQHNKVMNKSFTILLLFLLSCTMINAQEKSELHAQAEAEENAGNNIKARSLYLRAFEYYAQKEQIEHSVDCGIKTTMLYYTESAYKEAFEFLHFIDRVIESSKEDNAFKSSQRYRTSKERMQMYIRLRKNQNALDQIENMERYAKASNSDDLTNDLLYNKAIYYYTFGYNDEGNKVFQEMAGKLTAKKEYDKVDEVYRTLIKNGRRSNSANIVAQSYSNYMAWKDSINALKTTDLTNAFKAQIAENEATIAERNDSLASRKHIIIGLCIALAILTAVLVVGAFVLLRFIFLTNRQRRIIKTMKENNLLKVKFINNISAQLKPTLLKLDQRQPEVDALIQFSDHIQILSKLENSLDEKVELEEAAILPLCEELMNQIRNNVKTDVQLLLNVPKMTVRINQEYVAHILSHLLNNAAEHTPESGHIRLDFKKRGAHSHQFIVINTGNCIPEEERENIFKPFIEIHDLTKGDGLGLPICKQMAMKMNGDLYIDPEFTKGTRFVLSLRD